MAKRPRGRMTKKDQRAKNAEDIREELIDAVQRCDKKYIAHFDDYMEVIHKSAMGKLKGATPAQQVTSAKIMKEHCEAILKEMEASQKSETPQEGTTTQEEATVESASLIDMGTFKKEANS